jgi:hypothetical protein
MTQILQHLHFALEALARALVLGAEPHALDSDGPALGGVVRLGNDCLPARSDGLRQNVAAEYLRLGCGLQSHSDVDPVACGSAPGGRSGKRAIDARLTFWKDQKWNVG